MAETTSDNIPPLLARNPEKASSDLSLIGFPDDILPKFFSGSTLPNAGDLTSMANRQQAIKIASDQRNEERLRKEAMDAAKRATEVARQEILRLRAQEEGRFIRYSNPYYSGSQMGIFIGDRWVDDIITMEYTETVSKAPLYGYASTHLNAVAKGNVIVQGQFAIAFTSPGYLPAILQRYANSEGQRDTIPTQIADPIERARKIFWKLESPIDPPSIIPLEYGYVRGITGEVRRGFDIRVFFGAQEFIRESVSTPTGEAGSGPATIPTGPIEVIKNVHITSRSIVAAPSGEPIAEAYSFFASHVSTVGQGTPPIRVDVKSIDRASGTVPVASLGTNGMLVNQRFTPQP